MDQRNTNDFAALWTEVKTNLELRGEYIKVKAVQQVSEIAADVITNTFVIICFILAFLFGSITLGFFLSDLLKSYALGFGGLTIFYVLLATVVFGSRSRFIEKALVNLAIRKYFNKYYKEDEDEKA
ncbi:phage holin family protein [Pedobacter mucosus]|uniref:phage holin family protein n=1 Tax=Pedobacter mucosus TaxID=2895286 RepID=UPI001EE3D7C3|nr:phage holin family protein [Pedobacter mucosus]UKT62588.1 phage holin family protein [Pedobacter mucosus]